MVQVAVVEDQPEVRREISERVQGYFEQKGSLCTVMQFANGVELLEHKGSFQIIFLDIRMEGLSGVKTAASLRQRGEAGFLVFVTAFPDYVYEAFEVEASDYLLKPINSERFTRTMDRICVHIQKMDTGSLLLWQKGGGYKSLFFRDILYCEAIDHKIEIHTRQEIHLCHWQLKRLYLQLDNRFFLCHRSYIVNLDAVRGYEEGFACLSGGGRVPVSRLRAKQFSQAVLRNLIKEPGRTP